jgi:hypothetical protein
MHFHLPKPMHGWRELAGEVGIIVVGVLIALGAEQVVEALQWHEKVGVVRQSIMGELANDRARWEHDVSGGRCILHELDRLDAWAIDNVKGSPSTPLTNSSSVYSMHTANWTLASNSQTMDHFAIHEQIAFAALYGGLQNRQLDVVESSNLLDRLHTLIPLASDQQERLKLEETLGDLRSAIGSMLDNDTYMQRHFDALAVKSDRSDFAGDGMRAVNCRP